MELISGLIRTIARIAAADPNDDPQDLFQQVRPLLSKVALATQADASKTELEVGKTQGKNSLYCVYLRRGAIISKDILNRLKREEDNFNSIKWSSKAIMLYLWWPYKVPEDTGPTAPTAPVVPGTEP